MTHNYTLHSPTRVECLCCYLSQSFTFRSKSDQVVCEHCLHHQGSNSARANQRNQDHLGMWLARSADERAERAEEVRRLNADVDRRNKDIAALRIELEGFKAALQSELKQRPLADVQSWLESAAVDAATTERDIAYRSRDHVMRCLWELDRLHHEKEGQPNQCSCGSTAAQCREFQALSAVTESLYRWETRQLGRLRDNLPHGLPRHHPDVSRSEFHSAG